MALNDYTINYETLNGSPQEVVSKEQYQTEIVQRVYNRLCEQFKNKENIRKVLEYFLFGFGEIQSELDSLKNLRSLATAKGQALDVVGAQINVAREGLQDTAYRRKIFLKTLLGASEGSREDIISILRLESNGEKLRYWDIYPAAFQVFTDGVDASEDSAITVKSVTPAGVSSYTEVVASHGEIPFVLSESLPLNPTLALENMDDYISELGQLLELNIPLGDTLSVFYGGPFGETNVTTDEPYTYLGSDVGNIFSEVYQK
jgi:hypothetical protein